MDWSNWKMTFQRNKMLIETLDNEFANSYDSWKFQERPKLLKVQIKLFNMKWSPLKNSKADANEFLASSHCIPIREHMFPTNF